MCKHILIIAFILAFVNSSAQKRTKYNDSTHHVTVLYNFFSTDPLKILRSKTIKNNRKIAWHDTIDVRKLYYGDKINFRIKVNPFLYDVKINGHNIFDISSLDTAYVKTFMAFFNTAGIINTASGIKPTDVENAEYSQNDPVEAKKSPGDKELFSLKKLPVTTSNKKTIGKKIKEKEEEIKRKMKDAEETYRFLRDSIVGIQEAINTSFDEYQHEKTMLENILLLSLADYKEYDSIIREINSYIVYMRADSTQTFNIDSVKQSTDFVLRYFQRSAGRQARNMQGLYVEMEKLNNNYELSTFFQDSLLYSYYKSLADSMGKQDLNRFSRAYMAFLQNLGNKNLFEKNYNPEFATADSFQFQIQLRPSSRAREFIELYKLPLRDTIFKPYTLPVKRILKLNLSVGLSFMFGGAVASPYYFSTPKNQLADDDTVYIKKGAPKSAVIPRIALFTHLYWTNANWMRPAITFGISTNPADPSETAYMGGMSLLFGQNRRMIITTGVTLANIDVLKARYKTDDPRKKSFYSGVEESSLTEKKLRFGGFFGVSYNF